MDFGKYEKYMNDRKAVTVENNRRIEKKFAECEKWVADNLINCGCVFTNHSELLQKQSFMIYVRILKHIKDFYRPAYRHTAF